jgi:hypothetical protein
MKTFATLTITLMSFFAFSQQKPPFIPRPAVSFFFNEKLADNKKIISKTDTLLEVKAILQGEQKQKMPNMTFLITEVEVALIRNDKKVAALILAEGKGSLAPLAMLILTGDKCQLTIKGIKFLHEGVYSDVGAGDVIKNYVFE